MPEKGPLYARLRKDEEWAAAAALGTILPVKQHGVRLLSGMAQKPPDDRLGSKAATTRTADLRPWLPIKRSGVVPPKRASAMITG